MSQTVMVFAPHPDDAEFYAGGTLAQLAQQGDRILIVTVTDGGSGSFATERAELVQVRTAEAAAAAAVGGVAFSQTFLGFWSVMVFMTIGELIIMPTSSTYIANLAPADMRGRYMGLYGFSWSLAGMVAPVLGGYLSDNLNPRAPWLVGAGIGLLATLTFIYSAWLAKKKSYHLNT